ncbi:C39 family peptidase [Micropruina sp.]|uniref:C39 family peptidase n=1 Tax=Micropruina sp. TaxID=2737536 RepID=UPI0039E70B1B
MAPTIDRERALTLAAHQASLLVSAQALPAELADSEIDPEPTEVFDVNGEVLLWRARLRGERTSGWLDVAADSRVGALTMAAVQGAEWQPERLLEQAHEALREQGLDEGFDQVRFVAYSYPKLAIQFLAGDREVAMLELFTWLPIPDEPQRDAENFSRWSYFDSLRRSAEKRAVRFEAEIETISSLADQLGLTPLRISVFDISKYLRLSISRGLHYSTRLTDHETCFELRGQQTNVWCVGASVQMLLDFYRYEYSQVRLADELGLGTVDNPNGLPYANDSLVVTVIEKLTGNALNATMYTSNPFSRFRSEINANRPLISFIPGHSRAVAGYTDTRWLLGTGFQGLLVYDPWPPNSGVITRWENYNASTYRRTFTAQVTLV